MIPRLISRRLGVLTALLLWICTPESMAQTKSSGRWSGTLPTYVRNVDEWTHLSEALLAEGFYMGGMAAASRILTLFPDVVAKETAYRAVIQLVDQGYPFSTQELFRTGDLTPTQDFDFVNSYYLYKYLINAQDGMERWAKSYLSKVDAQEFPKYQFYLAIQAYTSGDLSRAETLLQTLLKRSFRPEEGPLVRKIARTLARLYFEKKDYSASLDVYQSFLLRLNPLVPSDWLESAWNLYYLKRYTEALGTLYNLESQSAGTFVNLEKYTIRALVYQALCATQAANRLIESFEADFGAVINAIKRGESIARYPQLIRLDVPGNSDFRALAVGLLTLKQEYSAVSRLPSRVRSLADYLYRTEVLRLSQELQGRLDQGLEQAAIKLIMMGEHLRFLRFDVQREQFNPDLVFQRDEAPAPKTTLISDLSKERFRISWTQLGDYWRDERDLYLGLLEDRCTARR